MNLLGLKISRRNRHEPNTPTRNTRRTNNNTFKKKVNKNLKEYEKMLHNASEERTLKAAKNFKEYEKILHNASEERTLKAAKNFKEHERMINRKKKRREKFGSLEPMERRISENNMAELLAMKPRNSGISEKNRAELLAMKPR
jgi:hypothetical protein